MTKKITYVHIVSLPSGLDSDCNIRLLRAYFTADVAIDDGYPWHSSLSSAVAFARAMRANDSADLLIVTKRTMEQIERVLPGNVADRIVFVHDFQTIKKDMARGLRKGTGN